MKEEIIKYILDCLSKNPEQFNTTYTEKFLRNIKNNNTLLMILENIINRKWEYKLENGILKRSYSH